MTKKDKKSQVYFWDLKTSKKASFDLRLRRLLKAVQVAKLLKKDDLVALKVHFGEQGTTGFISPIWLKPIIDFFLKSGAKPFLTDTNTLYAGKRKEAVSHACLAAEHGFDVNWLKAPIIIADGIKSNNQVEVEGPGKHFEVFYLAGDILSSDLLVTISHFTGHALTGFAGTIKNLAMGCASRQGKMQQHCSLGPKLNPEACQGCGQCIEVCQSGALFLDENKKIAIQRELCTGCAACLSACLNRALQIDWGLETEIFLERMVEYAMAVTNNHKRSVLHLTFVLQVTPECDCLGYSNPPICPDIGVLASYDPVALDQACLDLVKTSPRHPAYQELKATGRDVFQQLYPQTQGEFTLNYAQKLGLGQRDYQLIKI